MGALIREYRPDDSEPVVRLSLRAWAPVFASLRQVLGGEMFGRLIGDWEEYQRSAVRDVLADHSVQVWVAEAEHRAVAFIAVTLHRERLMGEIVMLAVDPDDQGGGVGTALTEFATDWLRGAGVRVAMVDTGGDPGHAPARHLYEKAGYKPLPVTRYFKAL
jgi:GNAT superfamily N-acetyltransferase